jgi:hypothetical protein
MAMDRSLHGCRSNSDGGLEEKTEPKTQKIGAGNKMEAEIKNGQEKNKAKVRASQGKKEATITFISFEPVETIQNRVEGTICIHREETTDTADMQQ